MLKVEIGAIVVSVADVPADVRVLGQAGGGLPLLLKRIWMCRACPTPSSYVYPVQLEAMVNDMPLSVAGDFCYLNTLICTLNSSSGSAIAK